MPSTDYETVFTTTRLNQRRAVPLTAQKLAKIQRLKNISSLLTKSVFMGLIFLFLPSYSKVFVDTWCKKVVCF